MENNVTEAVGTVTKEAGKAMKTLTTAQVGGMCAASALGGAGLGIASFVGIKAWIQHQKDKKAAKEKEKSEEKKPAEEKKDEEKKE